MNTTMKPINQNNMKAIMKYNLPDEKFEYDCAVNSVRYWSALIEIKDEIRAIWKYEELKENQFEMVERIREKFFEILTENEINLDRC